MAQAVAGSSSSWATQDGASSTWMVGRWFMPPPVAGATGWR
jgi:hypothetical protein